MRAHPVSACAVALAAVLTASVAQAQSQADLARQGKSVFRKCNACHRIGEGAKNAVGPALTGVVGRQAGSAPGYAYSKSMRAAGEAGLVWSQEKIIDYLADPTKYLRRVLDDPKARAKMTFKLKKEDDRRAVAAYLGSFSPAQAGMEPVRPTQFCIVNAAHDKLFFAVETREGERAFSALAPGERLCSAKTAAADGVVSVFKDESGFEGCSRIIPTGHAEEMREYAEFDRCRWSSQEGG